MKIRIMYHTQERRCQRLTAPIICTKLNAWLGEGYYFWGEEVDAIHWGNKSKLLTGFYEVYKADIDCDNVLDTVFNEDEYCFWVKQIEKAAKYIMKKTGLKATITEINQYFKEKSDWGKKLPVFCFRIYHIAMICWQKDLIIENESNQSLINQKLFINLDFVINKNTTIMIDLNKLERMLDEALEKETTESLTTWLVNQRIKNLLGDGSFEYFPSFTYSQKMSYTDLVVYIDEKVECDMDQTDYSAAA